MSFPPPISPPGAGGGGEQRGGGLPAATFCPHPGKSPPTFYFWGSPNFRVTPWGGGACHLHLPPHLPQEFIEEILSPPFGGMIAFVKEAEALLEKGQLERLRGEEGKKCGGPTCEFKGPPP